MQLNDILSISQIDYEKFSLNKNGTKASKPKNWYLAGRIILWFLSCGRFQVNPNLNEGSRKVIDATKEHLKFLKGEINI